MSRKGHRAGTKFAKSHTTVIPTAQVVVDIAYTQSDVTKIVLGHIDAGLTPLRGNRRVKILTEGTGLALTVRDNLSSQTLRVLTSNAQRTRLALARKLRDKGIDISFTR